MSRSCGDHPDGRTCYLAVSTLQVHLASPAEPSWLSARDGDRSAALRSHCRSFEALGDDAAAVLRGRWLRLGRGRGQVVEALGGRGRVSRQLRGWLRLSWSYAGRLRAVDRLHRASPLALAYQQVTLPSSRPPTASHVLLRPSGNARPEPALCVGAKTDIHCRKRPATGASEPLQIFTVAAGSFATLRSGS